MSRLYVLVDLDSRLYLFFTHDGLMISGNNKCVSLTTRSKFFSPGNKLNNRAFSLSMHRKIVRFRRSMGMYIIYGAIRW
jgi:hypothetical protein